MQSEDYYAVLGVLPDAEPVVITAAYRALAQRYHPDRWAGDTREAHSRMSLLNTAYEVLGDTQKRQEYDERRRRNSEFSNNKEDEAKNEAFDSALEEAEERWAIAVSVYPDLSELRSVLSKISTSLAFSFVVTMLELRAFSRRREIAEQMRRGFLQRYFGTNERIVNYAHALIVDGHKAAARALNKLVDVVGPDADATVLINRIENDFDLSPHRAQRAERYATKAEIARLVRQVKASYDYSAAAELSSLLGNTVQGSAGAHQTNVHVRTAAGKDLEFESQLAFVYWMIDQLRDARWW